MKNWFNTFVKCLDCDIEGYGVASTNAALVSNCPVCEGWLEGFRIIEKSAA